MQSADFSGTSGFYFSLPRLLAKWSGRPTERTERNWLEANVVGTLVNFVVYLFAFRTLLSGLPKWPQVLLLVPLAFAGWLFWLIVLYLFSGIIKLLRACGIFRTMADSDAQSFIICTMTTLFAWQLVLAGSWPALVGGLWMTAVALNLLAALLLAPRDGAHPSAK